MLKVLIAPVTPFQQNCSIVWCDETMEGTAVDPGGDFDMLKEAIAEQECKDRGHNTGNDARHGHDYQFTDLDLSFSLSQKLQHNRIESKEQQTAGNY